ncbi:MAG: hypothetical protein KDK45_09040, partial [Leptospiraceae bacterium]|nr:hypothetical protein [Leptospiraceae bacterium]
PGMGILFFAILLYKILPIVNITPRPFNPQNEKYIRIRIGLTLLIFTTSLLFVIYSIFIFSNGGLGNV